MHTRGFKILVTLVLLSILTLSFSGPVKADRAQVPGTAAKPVLDLSETGI